MNITPLQYLHTHNIRQIPENYKNNFKVTQTFTGVKVDAASEKGLQKCEYALRIIANRFSDLFEGKQTKIITKNIARIIPEQSEHYLNALDEISRWYSTQKTIDVNIEDKILEQIAKNRKSTIFIMNHSNQSEDPSMLAVLNTLLTEAYRADKNLKFPLPKIILNKDILTSMNPTRRKAFEAFGAVGIDANIYSADKGENARVFLPLIKDFVKDRCNIFIFPEGKLAIRKDMPFQQRFQSGTAEMVNKILGIKKEVTVVPVGFSYGEKSSKNLTGIQIGTPITFTRQNKNGETTTTAGSVLNSKHASEGLVKFFEKHKGEENITITENGIPVPADNISGFIKSILCENLNICSLEAKEKLSNPATSEIAIV